MTTRSHGRPTPSRGARVERRKAERAQYDGPKRMVIPPDVLELADDLLSLPCLCEPDCTVDHPRRRV
jgi:hypothetical protein